MKMISIPVDPDFYNIEISRVIDGDTIEGTYRFGRLSYETPLRFSGADTPETHRDTSWLDDQEFARELGWAAKTFTKLCLQPMPNSVPIRIMGIGKWGRPLACVYAPQEAVFAAIEWWADQDLFEKDLNGQVQWWGPTELQDRVTQQAPGFVHWDAADSRYMHLNSVLCFQSLARPNFYDSASKNLLKDANREPPR